MNIFMEHEDDWKELAFPECIAILPFTYQQLGVHYGLTFFDFIEDGLGKTYGCFASIGNVSCYLSSIPEAGGISEFVEVEILSTTNDSKVALSRILDDLSIKKESGVRMR